MGKSSGEVINLNKSYFDSISHPYSESLSSEIAILQRKIYLPLLPLEKLSYKVLLAYDNAGRSWWTKDEVFTSVRGNFLIPMMSPLVENSTSIEVIHNAPVTESSNGATSQYVTRSYFELNIPRHIVLMFNNVIPAGTKFLASFIGGSTKEGNIVITSVVSTVPVSGEFNDSLKDTTGMTQEAINTLVSKDLRLIDAEEEKRKKENISYANARDKAYTGSGKRINVI